MKIGYKLNHVNTLLSFRKLPITTNEELNLNIDPDWTAIVNKPTLLRPDVPHCVDNRFNGHDRVVLGIRSLESNLMFDTFYKLVKQHRPQWLIT